jgi:DNA helicase-2/ATP-dependent DNA helicase PcrA
MDSNEVDLFEALNPQQQQAVTVGLGPVLVLAGPGSGKTRVLTHRIAYLIDTLGVRPHSILAVTFTNKAAREMVARVEELVSEKTRGLTLGTFHATCAKILRREAANLPIQSNFVIFDQDDQYSLVKQAITELNIDEKRYRPAGVHAVISNAKNELILPDQYPVQNYRDEVIQRVFRRYQEMLLANNAVDFDDLLLYTAYLLEENPPIRDRYARRFEHILVDEFQDTNMAQYRLLRNLASQHRNLFVVGDADQSIYRWRGADYRNVLRFREDFPDAQLILLEQNYRSKQSILDLATAVIDHNPQRTPKRLFSDLGQGQKPILYEANDDRIEAAFVVDVIRKLISDEQANPGDFAVMYRTNAQSRLLEEAFLQMGIPYRLVGAQRFYGRKEIKDVIAYLRATLNPDDELSLTRIINTPTRGIGNKTYLLLKTQAQREHISPGRLLVQLNDNQHIEFIEAAGGRAKTALLAFAKHFAAWVGLKEDLPPLALMDRILDDTDLRSFIDDGTDEGQDRWENVLELRRLAAEYQDLGLTAFLEQIALVSDQDTIEGNTNAPTLLTLHAAKGLEFPVVFITGLNDGLLPHSRSFEDPEAMQEERRLFYVGITRAKEQLFLTYSQNRSAYGYGEPVLPSRYLDDIPFDLVDELQPYRSHKRSALSIESRPERWETSYEKPVRSSRRKEKNEQEQRFSPGIKVDHPVWGEGLVLNSRLQDDDEIVDVFFADVGLKHLAASLARLEIRS